MMGHLVENRVIIWDIGESRKLFGGGYYGKPVGVTKPKVEEIDTPLVLDLIEGAYLLESGRISIRQSGRNVASEEMICICQKEYDCFEKKYLVYRTLRDRGYVVNPGIKFGCDFAVYERGPGIDHAPYMVHVYRGRDPITPTGLVLAGRLATAVRKQFILAIPSGRKVDFVALDWWRA